jgi:hypothetical protein
MECSLIMSGLQTKAGEAKSWQSEFTRLDDEVEVLTQKQAKAPTKLFQ